MTLAKRLHPGAAAFINEANRCAANGLFVEIKGAKLGNLQAGQVVEVLAGPFDTAEGIVYWQVYSPFLRAKGYTPEGRPAHNDYWLDPVPTVQTFHVIHRLTPGVRAFVETKTEKPNRLRQQASADAPIIASVPGGTVVTLDDSAAFFNDRDGWLWWFVTANGQQGWMAEVRKGEYNLLPLTVPVRCA